MKTLDNEQARQEILQRLKSIHPDSPRVWGRMSAHQMICHLNDGFRIYMNEKPAKPVPVWYPRPVLRWFALWAPIPWPRGFKAPPELDQQIGGTPPAEFQSDVNQLHALIARCTAQPRNFEWQPHPHFGQMSTREWMRLAYLHADHHLRQFGA